MKFFFCEKCGKRVTDADVESGQARDKQAKGVFCRDCSAGVMTMTFEAMSEQQAHDHLKKELPSSAKLPPAAPAKPPSRDSQARMAPSFRKPAPIASPQQNHSVIQFAAGGAGALALLLIAWFALSSTPQESAKTSHSDPKASPPAQKPPAPAEAPPPAVPAPAPDTSSAGTEKTREATGNPAKTLPREEKDPVAGEGTSPSPGPAKDPSQPADLKDGLLLHMKFDGDLADSGPLKLTGVCKNQTCEYGEGIFGKAIAPSKADNDSVVTLPRNKALYASETFSVAFWVRLEQVAPRGTWVVWNHCRWGVGVKAKSLVLMLNGLSKNPEFTCPTASDKGWHHIVMVWDGKKASCYFEGKLLESREISSVNLKNNMTWTIAILGSPWHESMIGAVDDFRLYNRPITAAEAAQLAKR